VSLSVALEWRTAIFILDSGIQVAAGAGVLVAVRLFAKGRGFAPLSAGQNVSTFLVHGLFLQRKKKSGLFAEVRRFQRVRGEGGGKVVIDKGLGAQSCKQKT
jgi:hypothetical protein